MGYLAVAFLVVAAAYLLAPAFVEDPLAILLAMQPSKTYYDRDGEIIGHRRGYDYQWRFPVKLEDVSPHFIHAILAAEDNDFYSHGGVSYKAILRAAKSNLSTGMRLSGASTISMQLAVLPWEGRRKNYGMKLRQLLMARKLEAAYSKEEILEEYINRIPFGGKIYGVEAAAKYYFGKTAASLDLGEAAMLAGLPQRPNAFRPDKHPARARQRQRLVLRAMARNGYITNEDAVRLNTECLNYRSFRQEPFFMHSPGDDYRMFLRLIKENGSALHTTLDIHKQKLLIGNLKQACAALPDVKDAAAVLLSSRTGEVLAFVGTIDFRDRVNGQVNAAIAWRSAGSTLKPFIYAEAIDGGLISEATILKDAPVRFGNYLPANFDGKFHGDVTASYALGNSLNIPVIGLLSRLGLPRVVENFTKLGLLKENAKDETGLTLALGTSGTNLLRLTSAYTIFSNDGVQPELQFLTSEEKPRITSVCSPGCARMIAFMLRQNPLPESTVEAAWKTGTSNGYHDAWCIAFTQDYTLGVWFGNKDGRSSSYLVGGRIAAPVAGRILSAIYATQKMAEWPMMDEYLQRVQLCKKSGLPPSSSCVEMSEGWVLKEFSPKKCAVCNGTKVRRIGILSPKPGTYSSSAVSEDDSVSLLLQTDCPDVLWYIDGIYAGDVSPDMPWKFLSGHHILQAFSTDGSVQEAVVEFDVIRNH